VPPPLARRRPEGDPRGGYALLAVLWICMGVGVLGLGIAAAARDAIARSRNRAALVEAEWTARGCLARLRSRAVEVMTERPLVLTRRQPGSDAWNRLDSLLVAAPGTPGMECAVTVRAAGATLDVNFAPEALVAATLRNAGVAPEGADSMAAALADWRDADGEPRELGAERGWYLARGMVPPPDRPFLDAREIGLVRGMDHAPWQELLGADGGGISLQHAPPAVLAALPGFGPQAVAHTLELRERGELHAYQSIADGLAPTASVALMDALPQLVSLVTLEPTAWTVRAEARAGRPAVRAAAQMRLTRTGTEPRVVQQRIEFP